jgi:hypothetical protein
MENFNQKTTELHIAVKKIDIDKIKELLVAGADANARDENGDTPAMLAARMGWCLDLGGLSNAADMSLRDADGLTAKEIRTRYLLQSRDYVDVDSLAFSFKGFNVVFEKEFVYSVGGKYTCMIDDSDDSWFVLRLDAQCDDTFMWGERRSENWLSLVLDLTQSDTDIKGRIAEIKAEFVAFVDRKAKESDPRKWKILCSRDELYSAIEPTTRIPQRIQRKMLQRVRDARH